MSVNARRVTRAWVVKASGGLLAASAPAALAACSTRQSAGNSQPAAKNLSGTLEVWGHSQFPFDQDVGADVVRSLQKKYPGLQVTFNPANDQIGAKLRVAAAGGAPPDVVTTGSFTVQGLALEKGVISFDPLLKTSKVIKKSDLWPTFMQDVTWKGEAYCLPYAPDLRLMYVNQDRFSRVGLDANKPPQTWADLQNAIAKTLERDGTTIKTMGFDPFIGSGLFNLWLVPFWQLGGELLSPDGTKVTIATDKGIKAWQWITQLIDQQGGWQNMLAFRQGRTPYQIFADNNMAFLYDTNSVRSEQLSKLAPSLKFGFSTYPLPPSGRRASFGGLWVWVIPTGAKLRDAAWLFLEEALSEENNLIFANRYDRVPIRQSTTHSEKYLRGDPFRKLVVDELPWRKTLITAPGGPDMRTDIMEVATNILEKNMLPADALAKSQATLQLKLDAALKAGA